MHCPVSIHDSFLLWTCKMQSRVPFGPLLVPLLPSQYIALPSHYIALPSHHIAIHCITLLVPLLPSQCHCPSSHALRGPTIVPHHPYDKHSTINMPNGATKEPLWSSPMPDWLSDDVTFSLIHHRIDFNCRSLSRPNWIVTLSSPNWIVTAPVGRVSHPCSSCLLSKGTSLNLQK